jgi:tetratricopeptide (TPR) repeat protein
VSRALAPALVVTLALLAAAPAPAQRTPPITRQQALERMTQPDPEARRQGAAGLGDLGRMDDVPTLLAALRDADAVVRVLAHHAIWQIWSRSGDVEVDALFAVGVEQMNRQALAPAIETFSRVIERRPEFAEGWNKRATAYYLAGQYEKSLKDCDEVLKRNPYHFGALSGYGQIYLQLGQPERALHYFERALAVNPTLEQVEQAIEQLRRVVIERRRRTI